MRKIKYPMLLIIVSIFMIGLIPTIAQGATNPCDSIEYTGDVQATLSMTQTELIILSFENGFKRNYDLGEYQIARTMLELALGASNDEWALGYFYRACIQLQQGNTSAAMFDFETFVEMTDDLALANAVVAFTGSDSRNVSEDESSDVVFIDEVVTFPESLQNYEVDRESLMSELSDETGLNFSEELIVDEASSSLVVQNDTNFVEFAPASITQNFIMGGRINFSPVERLSSVHSCGLLSRTQREVREQSVLINEFLFLGFDSDGEGTFLQDSGRRSSSSLSASIGSDYDYDEEIDVLLLVLHNRATVYVDGELMLENFEIEPMFGGGFALISFANGTGVECSVQDLFVYELLPATPCLVTVDGNVNKRSGPGTNFEQVGLLSADDNLRVTGQSQDVSGFTWWQINEEAWVREDVVSILGTCDNIPQVD